MYLCSKEFVNRLLNTLLSKFQDSLERCRNLLKRSILQAELDANGDISSESQGVTWGEVLDLTGVVLRQILQKSRGKETPGTREERDAAVNLLDMVVGLSIQSKFGCFRCFDIFFYHYAFCLACKLQPTGFDLCVASRRPQYFPELKLKY